MRVALIADVHSNFEGLLAVSDVLETADQVVSLGDLVGYYCQVNEVIEHVRRLDAICVMGNHDWFLVDGCPEGASEAVRFGIEYARKVIDPENLSWLERHPLTWTGEFDSRSWFACHGSPWGPLDDYLYSDDPRLESLPGVDCDLLAFGQTHRPLLREGTRPVLLNPGSVGQSRHAPGLACAALVDTSTMRCDLVERPYDTALVVQRALAAGAGGWIRKHLVGG